MTEVRYEGDRVSYSDGWLTTCEIASHPRSLPVLELEKATRTSNVAQIKDPCSVLDEAVEQLGRNDEY